MEKWTEIKSQPLCVQRSHLQKKIKMEFYQQLADYLKMCTQITKIVNNREEINKIRRHHTYFKYKTHRISRSYLPLRIKSRSTI